MIEKLFEIEVFEFRSPKLKSFEIKKNLDLSIFH